MTIDDLLAARLLHKERPELKDQILEVLAELEETPERGGLGFRTLLGEALRRGAISRDQASFVHAQVGRLQRGRALGIYTEFLVQDAQLARGQVEAEIRALGAHADCARLDERLVAAGLLGAQTTARLRFQAKVVMDRDGAEQLETFAKRRRAESASTLVAGAGYSGLETGVAGDKIPSGVFRNELVLPTSAEATGIIDRASLGFALRTPRFPVPDWVDTSDPHTGRLIGGFRILGLVGKGAMAKVYLADHAEIEEPIALKLLPPSASKERQARFKREILANGFFSHPNVIDLYDAGVSEDGHHYLAMEFFDGADLEQVLESEGSLALTQSLDLAVQLLEALDVAHTAGIVHRDLKPGNVMVDAAGTRAKLTDFGIALIKDLGDFKDKVFESDDGGITGTPEYLSPEQAFRDPLGPASDLYSLGLVLYRMLAGRLPFEAETVPGWVNVHIAEEPTPLNVAAPEREWPPELLTLFAELFEKDPKRRLQSALEVAERLNAIRDTLGPRRTQTFNRVRGGF